MTIEAMKLALEALEFLELENFVELDKSLNVGPTHGRKAILALRAAIEQAHGDWDEVEALRASLREHMVEIQRLRSALEQAHEPLTEKRIEELYSFWIVDCQDIVGFVRAIERTVKGEV